jgi:preprotein translocase subunit SecD
MKMSERSPVWMVAALAATTVTGALAAETALATLEFRLVVDCKAGSVPLAYDNQGMAAKLCLSPDLILDRSDVVNAREVHTVYGTDAIRITIGEKAIARLSAATSAHVGGRLGIVYNGKLVSAPIVQEPITGNEVEISMGSANDDLSAIAAGLRGAKPQ